MQYDFDEMIDRSQNYAAKIEEAHLHYGTNDVIPLWIADMDFRTAQPIIDAIKKRADQGIFGYTYRPDAYFQTIADWQQERNGYMPDLSKMAFSSGVVPAMRMFLNLFTKPGDKILIQQPVYHPFEDIVRNTGRTLVVNELVRDENGFYTMDLEDFEKKLASGVKYVIFCNPHNPVGRVWTKAELLRMGGICAEYGAGILSDEIHSDLMLGDSKHTVMASVSPEISAVTTTFIAPSKTFNLAGLQSSTIIFNTLGRKDAYVAELKQMDIARNNCFSLVASMAAYTEGAEWLSQLLPYIRENMRFIQAYCSQYIPVLKPNDPQATYLNWIDARGLGLSDDELKRFMVEKAGVAMNSGADFGQGGSGFLRMNAACPRITLEKALKRIQAAIDSLQTLAIETN